MNSLAVWEGENKQSFGDNQSTINRYWTAIEQLGRVISQLIQTLFILSKIPMLRIKNVKKPLKLNIYITVDI